MKIYTNELGHMTTMAAMPIKVKIWVHRLLFGRSIQLNELMKLSEYQRSRSFSDLGQRSLRFHS